MSKYCQNRGNAINENEKFCGSCGAPIAVEQPVSQPYQGSAPTLNSYYGSQMTPGFSDRVNDPEILAAVKKNKKAGKLFAFFIIPLPLIGFVVYSLVTEKMELNQALMAGGFVSFVFLICTLISAIKSRASKSYEAVVTDKKQRERAEHSNDDNTSYYTQYITYAKTDDGKKRKLLKQAGVLLQPITICPSAHASNIIRSLLFPMSSMINRRRRILPALPAERIIHQPTTGAASAMCRF